MAEDWTDIMDEPGGDGSQPNEKVNRRQFVTAVVAATAGSIATGTVLGVYNRNQVNQAISSIPEPVATTDFSPVIDAAETAQQELMAQLTAAQAENLRLQTELDGTLRRLEIAEQAVGSTSDEATLLRTELASMQEQQGVLAGLLALYEQLDNVDLGEIVSGGLTRVSTLFGGLMDELPAWSGGLIDSEGALAQFEEQLPTLDAGREWLAERLAALSGIHLRVEQMLQTALDKFGPVLELLQEWFDDVLSWLPFGMGSKAQNVMIALTELMTETPETIQSVQARVSLPLDGWLKPVAGQNKPAIQTQLFEPVREKAIRSGEKGIGMVKDVQGAYQSDLVGRVATRMADRRIVQDLISRYRDEHQLARVIPEQRG